MLKVQISTPANMFRAALLTRGKYWTRDSVRRELFLYADITMYSFSL